MIVRATRRTSQWTRAVAETGYQQKPNQNRSSSATSTFFHLIIRLSQSGTTVLPVGKPSTRTRSASLPKLNLTRGVAGRRASPQPVSSFGQDRSPALRWHPGLLRNPPDLRRHRSRKRYYSASKRKPRYGCAQTLSFGCIGAFFSGIGNLCVVTLFGRADSRLTNWPKSLPKVRDRKRCRFM